MVRKVAIGLLVLVLASGGSLWAVAHRNRPVEAEGYRVGTATYKEVVSGIGTVEYGAQMEVKTEVGGKLTQILGEPGGRVASGQTVARLDEREARLQLEQQVGNRDLARARVADYQRNYSQNVRSVEDQRALQEKETAALRLEREQLQARIGETAGLVEEGILPAQDLTRLQEADALLEARLETADTRLAALRPPVSTLQEAQAAVEAAADGIRRLELELAKYQVKAPLDGIVLERRVEPGAVVQPGEVLLVVAADGRKYAVLDLDEKLLGKVALGQEAALFLEVDPSREVKGRVSGIGPAVDRNTGTVEVKVEILEQRERFLQNMSVRVEFVAESFEGAVVLPGRYLLEGEPPAVYVLSEEGTAARREIKVHTRNAPTLMVLEGLEAGAVVLAPEGVKEGTKVSATFREKGEGTDGL
ncbi:efflux RND transporter periplasmic adaptor subunit [Anaerotalea alkaliphila]|uniref:Efflux RND transporter periplasmic adaptor subunit n=1 Tax=Anaerotalea alkaliphila TaxID=2662126 RepID=A0A7X5HXY3_9FIRM|nr:efflux RND transporter periplasmic adaptor subunit [Anaerotalea alkaliphila]NDL68670.1 efflux RND transporter periplasmic adaptor subunit [Anaerotalea alkaliphila]